MQTAPPPELAASELRRWRAELPLVNETIHLVSHSLGPMPRAVEGELVEYARQWRERGVRAWNEGWWEIALTTGDLLAPLLGAAPGTVAMHPNVSVALAVLLSAIDYPTDRPRVVTLAGDFHTDRYLLYGERRKGAEIELVPLAADGMTVDEERLHTAIDPRTRLVLVSHVQFTSGAMLDAGALARRCREVGALLLLDVYQSAGIVPLALESWGVDAAVGGSVKWLCGGPGAGYLYVRPELASALEPTAIGWQADAEPFAFRDGPIRLAAGAQRFLTGTPTVPSLVACRPGYRMIAEVGVERIRARSTRLTARLLDGAAQRGIATRTPPAPQRRGGTVTLAHADSERIGRELVARGVLCDHRPGFGVRIGAHFFNTDEEVDRALDLFAEIASE